MLNFLDHLPPEFEAAEYRSAHPDLASMNDEELSAHYFNFGVKEGRAANRLRNRNDFVALIPGSATVLEIGPFCIPILTGPNVSYFDVLSHDRLVERAINFGLDPANTPHIDYVSAASDLSVVDRRFDVVLSSHSLEHQPNLIGHLHAARQILKPGGAYFVLFPDKRYCFDHFLPESNVAELIIAHCENRRRHVLRSVIEQRTLTTHNDNLRHWQGDHGAAFQDFGPRYLAAVKEFEEAVESIDVHAWYLTPDSARAALDSLAAADLIPLRLHRLYPTRYGSNEFWMVLC
jgi:SAM-dependent methyltransferase